MFGTRSSAHRTPGRFLVTLFAAALLSASAFAAFLRDYPTTLTQPDGSTISAFLWGDENYNWAQDKKGFVLIQNPDTGYYVYAKSDAGAVVATNYVAGTVDPRSVGLEPDIRPSAEFVKARRDVRYPAGRDTHVQNAPHSGTLNNIVILIRFSGEAEFTTAKATYDGMFIGTTGTNSMKNYFNESSYGALTVNTTYYPTTTTTKMISYQDSHTRGYFQPYNATSNPGGYSSSNSTAREHALLKAAVDAVSSQIPSSMNVDGDNDGYVDNVCFVIKGDPGAWAELLWPHMWSLYSVSATINSKRVYTYNFQLENPMLTYMGVGVLAHEMTHSLGAPDLYHYSYDGLSTVGSWDLMENDTDPPQYVGAYMKYRYMKWISSIPEITTSGTYTLNPLQSATGNCYKIKSPNSTTQYFVLEYRRKTGTFEGNIPGSGLLVYRINTAYDGQGDASGPPDEIYIFRPGGTTTATGSISMANLSSTVSRTVINDYSNPKSYLSTGAAAGLNISAIGAAGTTISFTVNIMSGAATRAVFQTQPGGAYSGEALNPQPVVKIVDSTGGVVTSSSLPVTLTIRTGTGAAGAVLSGTTTVNAVNGVATFSGLSIDKVGTYYTLSAAATGLVGSDSTTFDIAQKPTQLVFTSQPSSVYAAQTLAPTVVEVRDAANGKVTGYTGPVTIAIKPGTGAVGAILAGTKTVNAVAGVAQFANLTVDKPGTGYVLVISSGTLPSVETTPLDVMALPSARLAQTSADEIAVSIYPAGKTILFGEIALDYPGTDLADLTPADVRPATGWSVDGVNVTSGKGTISLSSLAGTATDGPAAYLHFTAQPAFKGKTTNAEITASSYVTDSNWDSIYLASGHSSFVPGGHLTFLTQPGAADVNATLPGPPRVALQDGSATTVTDFSGGMDVVIKPGTGTTGAVLSGATSVLMASGEASFDGLQINTAGQGYVLTAVLDPFTLADSSPFNVGAAPLTLTDVAKAISGASGFTTLTPADVGRLNVDNTGDSTGVVDMADAVAIARLTSL